MPRRLRIGFDITPPGAPGTPSVSVVSSSALSVSWAAATDTGGAGLGTYRVERATAAGGPYTQVGVVGAPTPSYSDAALSPSTTYFYRVRAVDASNNVGPFSLVGSGTTQAGVGGATRLAASASLADVQAAVNAAVDGDTVLIPNGTATWNGGIVTTKQIIIRAQNITPTKGGNVARNVTITPGSATRLFTFTSGNSHHCGVGGIRFNAANGSRYLQLLGTGSKVPLVFDCWFEFPIANGNNPGDSFIPIQSQGAVFWNCRWQSTRSVPSQMSVVGGLGCFMSSPRAWQSASTMGTLDTNGTVNVYVEDCSAQYVDAIYDVDQSSRLVVRYSDFDGSWFLTHGFTSGMYAGGRHVEIYNNTFVNANTQEAKNISGRYFWLRAGTCVITDNVSMEDVRSSDYGGSNSILNIGDNTSPGGSTAMQPGWGHNGTTDVLDPIYVWNNTGTGANVSFNDQSGNWSGVTSVATVAGQAGAELFVNLGAKPGYAKYTYPHPFRSAV
jgi:hypothetical protein